MAKKTSDKALLKESPLCYIILSAPLGSEYEVLYKDEILVRGITRTSEFKIGLDRTKSPKVDVKVGGDTKKVELKGVSVKVEFKVKSKGGK